MPWKTRTRKEKWWMVSSLIHDLNYRQTLKDGSLHLFAPSLESIAPFQGYHLIVAHEHALQFDCLATTPELSFSLSTTSRSSYFSFFLYLISRNLVNLSGLVNFVEEVKSHTSMYLELNSKPLELFSSRETGAFALSSEVYLSSPRGLVLDCSVLHVIKIHNSTL
jgi:hypothetical protein